MDKRQGALPKAGMAWGTARFGKGFRSKKLEFLSFCIGLCEKSSLILLNLLRFYTLSFVN